MALYLSFQAFKAIRSLMIGDSMKWSCEGTLTKQMS
jgi:hypothetical protein